MTIPIFHHTFDPTGVSLTYDSGWVIISLVIAAIVTVSIFVPIVEKIEKTLKKNPPKSVVKFVSCTLLGIAALVVALAVVGLLAFFVPLYLADKTNTTFFTRPMVTSEDLTSSPTSRTGIPVSRMTAYLQSLRLLSRSYTISTGYHCKSCRLNILRSVNISI